MHDQRLAYPYNDEDDMAGMLILSVIRMWHKSGHREDEHKARSSRTPLHSEGSRRVRVPRSS